MYRIFERNDNVTIDHNYLRIKRNDSVYYINGKEEWLFGALKTDEKNGTITMLEYDKCIILLGTKGIYQIKGGK